MADEKLEILLHRGANMSQLADIFKMDARDIKAKLAGNVLPSSKVGNIDLWSIAEVAPYLTQPAWDIDEFISRMTKADLPVTVSKEFWAGMRSRQLYEIEQGDLWRSDMVIDAVSEMFKTLRMSILLIRETVERQSELTSRQRELINNIIETALKDLHDKTAKLCERRCTPNNGGSSAAVQADCSEEV